MKTSFLALLSSAALVWGCGDANNAGENGETNEGKASGTIQIDGSSTVYPITEAVAEEFRAHNGEVRVTVGYSGTGGGFKKFIRGEIDINDASRPIKQSEHDDAVKAGITYIELPVAYDGLAVVVHPENNWVSSITVAELKKIWEPGAQGKITRWNQVRPEWPNEEIHLFGAGVESGTYDYFTEAIVGESHASRGDYTASEDDNVLVQGISGDKFSLGFFGLAYYEENKSKLKLIPVDDENDANGKGPVSASLETVRNGTYQPLSRPIFIYVASESAKRPEVQEFVKFYLENTRSLSQEVGYVPLPDEISDLTISRFASGKTGSVFLGKSDINVDLKALLSE